MPQTARQILKDAAKEAARCWAASKPPPKKEEDVSSSERPGTPRPSRSGGPRPLFSIPTKPPTAFFTRGSDKAIERLQSAQQAELANPSSKAKPGQGKTGRPSSSSNSLPPASPLAKETHIATDDVTVTSNFDFADITEVLRLVDDKTDHSSSRTEDKSHKKGDFVLKGSRPASVKQQTKKALSQPSDAKSGKEHHAWSAWTHRNKQVTLPSESHDGDDQANSAAYSSQNHPRRPSTPSDLTDGILGPPAYKPPNQPPGEVSVPKDSLIDRAKKGEDKSNANKHPTRGDSVPTNSPSSKSSTTRSTLETAPKKRYSSLPPSKRAPLSSTSTNSARLPTSYPHFQPQSTICTSRLCPVLVPHSLGLYLHENKKRERPEIYFGDSNPPPIVWAAVDLMSKGKANQRDEEIIAEFIKLHHGVLKNPC